jgi:hypothetical protein
MIATYPKTTGETNGFIICENSTCRGSLQGLSQEAISVIDVDVFLVINRTEVTVSPGRNGFFNTKTTKKMGEMYATS